MSHELAVGESMTREEGDLRVRTTRTEEHLFTTTYEDPDTDAVRLAMQVDITTGETAIDPRHVDASFWTLIAEGTERPVSDLRAVLGEVPNPSIEVQPERRAIRVYSEEDE